MCAHPYCTLHAIAFTCFSYTLQGDEGVVKLNGQLPEDWHSHYTSSSSHEPTPSDTSQLSGKLNDSRGHLSGGQLSGQSGDELRTSGDGMTSSNHAAASPASTSQNSSNLKRSTSTNSNSGKRAVRGYKSQRALLHKTRNKNSQSDIDASNGPGDQQGGKSDHNSGEVQDETDGSALLMNGRSEGEANTGTGYSIPIIRHFSAKERSGQDSSNPRSSIKHDHGRPLSAIEAPIHINAVNVTTSHTHSTISHTYSSPYDSRLKFSSVGSPVPTCMEVNAPDPLGPLFTTRTALTPSGEQVVREVNIEDAIRRSQGMGGFGTASQDHTHSMDDELNDQRSKGRKVFTRYVGLLE